MLTSVNIQGRGQERIFQESLTFITLSHAEEALGIICLILLGVQMGSHTIKNCMCMLTHTRVCVYVLDFLLLLE